MAEPEGQLVSNCIAETCRSFGLDYHLLAETSDIQEAMRYIKKETGLTITVLGVDAEERELAGKLKLALLAQKQNRDNCLLLILAQYRYLEPFVNHNTRPNGVLLVPLDAGRTEKTVARIVRDFSDLLVDTSAALMLKTEDSICRLPVGKILVVEANEKKLNIYTATQCVTVSESLKGIAPLLPEHFIQSHRSYLINRNYINNVSFSQMVITMRNNMQVPIARGAKNEVKQMLGLTRSGDDD